MAGWGWAWLALTMLPVGCGHTGTTVLAGVGTVSSGQAAAASAGDAELERMQRQMADWGALGRYRAANQALPARVPGRVVFFGASIVENWGKPENAAVFFPGKPYVDRGISGQTTPQMLLRFRQDVIDLHPEAVVILGGTNDVAENNGPMTPRMTEDNVRSMAELGRANGIRVILCSITPAGDFPWRRGLNPAPKIIALNAWMRRYAAEQGLTYVDLHAVLADGAGAMKVGLSSDGVHPTAAGYRLMEPLVEAALAGK